MTWRIGSSRSRARTPSGSPVRSSRSTVDSRSFDRATFGATATTDVVADESWIDPSLAPVELRDDRGLAVRIRRIESIRRNQLQSHIETRHRSQVVRPVMTLGEPDRQRVVAVRRRLQRDEHAKRVLVFYGPQSTDRGFCGVPSGERVRYFHGCDCSLIRRTSLVEFVRQLYGCGDFSLQRDAQFTRPHRMKAIWHANIINPIPRSSTVDFLLNAPFDG